MAEEEVEVGLGGVALQAIGGLAGAFAQNEQGAADAAYLKYQSDLAEVNRQIKLQQQAEVLEQGKIQIGVHTEEVGQIIADNITRQAGSGFVISDDSIDTIMRLGDRQTEELRKNIEASAFEVGLDALGLQSTSAAQSAASRSTRSAARSGALTSGLSTVDTAFTKAQKLGAFE